MREPGHDAGGAPTTAAELAQRERELAVLSAVIATVGSGGEPLEVLSSVAAQLRTILPPGPLLGALVDDDSVTLTPLIPPGASVQLRMSQLDRTLLGEVLRQRQVARGRIPAALHPSLSDHRSGITWLAAPMSAGDLVFGALLAGNSTPDDRFDERHAQILRQVALHVGVFLEHAYLHDDMQRQVRQIETLREVVESISSELDQERLLQRIVAAAVDLLQAYGGAVGLVRPDGDALELSALVNIPEQIGQVIPAGAGVMGLVLSRQAPVIVDDYGEVPQPLPIEALYQLAPWLAAPIFWQGRITGVFGICAADPSHRFTDADVGILTLFAKHAAIAIENARLYQQSRELAVTEERNRLAREIHDTLAQSLTGMVLQIQVVEDLLADEPEQARAELRSLRQLARTALEEARRSVWGLRPPVLEEASLAEALERQLRDASRAAGFSPRFSIIGRPRPLTGAIEAGVYRIAQEALTNIQRHAGAQTAVVQLRFEAGALALVVQDDGRGFPGDDTRTGARTGFGLTSMQERARLLGGAIAVQSATGRGTRIEVRIPYVVSASDSGATHRPAGGPGPENWPIRVLVADDHDVARHGIIRMLESQPDIVVVAEAADGVEALVRSRELRPDVILVDLQMPGLSGIEVIESLCREGLTARPVILTTYARDDLIVEGIRAGARGFLLKDVSAEELARTVRTVNEGRSLLQPVVATRLVEQIGRMARQGTEAELLTPRERDVLKLLVEGARNKEISARLHIAHGTVRFHVGNIFQKLGVSSRTEAVRRAMSEGLVP